MKDMPKDFPIEEKSLQERDQSCLWHPFTPLSKSTGNPAIVKGQGQWLYDTQGKIYLDAISSWWVNIHGHCHPYIVGALQKSLPQLDQTIFADFTHEPAITMAERLLALWPFRNLGKVFLSDNGSTSVEVALKMAMQRHHLRHREKPTKRKSWVLALDQAYHGDTFGAMALGSRGLFSAPFSDYLFEVVHLPIHHSGVDQLLGMIAELQAKGDIIALIYEPLVQGSAGMLMPDLDCLNALLRSVQQAGGLLIADEVMTGFGRTGTMFASQQLEVAPDLVCLSKGITGGVLPLGATLVSAEIVAEFALCSFRDSFFHGHSYTGNPWACVAANASLDLFSQAETWEGIHQMNQGLADIAGSLNGHHLVSNVRHRGGILAFDLQTPGPKGYENSVRDQVRRFFMDQGVFVRPLGQTVYFMPPYCLDATGLRLLERVTHEFLNQYEKEA